MEERCQQIKHVGARDQGLGGERPKSNSIDGQQLAADMPGYKRLRHDVPRVDKPNRQVDTRKHRLEARLCLA